jgi:hypothetical protein
MESIPLEALVTLVITFNKGSSSTALRYRERQRELLDWIDGGGGRSLVIVARPRLGDPGRLPGRRLRRARRRHVYYEVYGAARPCSSADVVDHPFTPLEIRSYLPRHFRVLVRRPRERTVGPAR